MYYHVLILISLASMLSQPASAQTKPVSAPAALDSLLQLGYEIKDVSFIPLAQANEIFGTNAPKTASQTLVTLQKGASVAVCTIPSGGWALLDDGNMTDNRVCEVR